MRLWGVTSSQLSHTIKGHNSIIVVLGANLHLTSDDVEKCSDLIKNAKILVTNLEIPVQTALNSLKLAKENNCEFFLKETNLG